LEKIPTPSTGLSSKWILFWISLVSLKIRFGPLSCQSGFFVGEKKSPGLLNPDDFFLNFFKRLRFLEVKFNSLCQRKSCAVIDGIRLSAHIDFPGIRT